MFNAKKHLISLLSISLVFSSCANANNDGDFVINETTAERAVALTSKVLSNEGDLLVEIQGNGVTFDKNVSNSQALVRDLSKSLPDESTSDDNNYITYNQLKTLCVEEYFIYTSSNAKSLYITIPNVPANSAYSLILSPTASSLGEIGYASFSNLYSEESADELQVKALNTNKANGYFNEWSFVYSYQNGALADTFSIEDVILTGAFDNCRVFSLTSDDSHIEVRLHGLVNNDLAVGYVGFNSTAFKDNETSFVFPYQIEYPTAVMLNYTYKVDISKKEASFEMAFYDAEIPSSVSVEDVNIEGISCKEVVPNVEENTVKFVLDTGDYDSEEAFTQALEAASITFSFLDLLTVDLSYLEPQIEVNAYTKDEKTYLEFFPLEYGTLSIDTEKLTDSLYIPFEGEEPFLDLTKAEIKRNSTGNGYVLSWDGVSEQNQGQLMILDGTLTVGEYEIPLIGNYSYFSFVNYLVNEHDNALLRRLLFAKRAVEVDDGNIGSFDSEITQAAQSAASILGIISAVVGGVLGILGAVFGVEGTSKMVTVGILGFASFGLSMASMIAGMNEMEEGMQKLAEAIQFVSGNVVEIRRDLMALSYKVDTLLVKQRMNHDRQMYEMYRDRLSDFQKGFEKPIYDLQSEFGDLTNAYIGSLFRGNTTGNRVFGNVVTLRYTDSTKYNASGISYYDEKHGELLDEDATLTKSFTATFVDQSELFRSTYNTFRKSMQINDAVKVKAINAIKEGLTNGAIVLSGNNVPEIKDDTKAEIAEDIYQACTIRAEYLALSSDDKENKYEDYLKAADDYFMRFSGTGIYEGEAAASYMYKMLTLKYNFQSEVEKDIHKVHAQYGTKLLQMYTNAIMISRFNDLTYNANRVFTSYKAASDYLAKNTWIQEYKGDKSKLPEGEETLLDYCYVTDTFVRIGTIETRFDFSMDKKNFKVNGTYAYEVNLADPNFKADKKQAYMMSLAQLSSLLVNAENIRVIMERKKMISTASNSEYILKNASLFNWDQYVTNFNRITSDNKGKIMGDTMRNGTKVNINQPRFIYAYSGAEAINSGDPATANFKCLGTFKAWPKSNYFKLNELTDAYGKGSRDKASKQYWDGWVIKGEVGTLDEVSFGSPSSNINRLVHYHEAHGYWANDEHWCFEEYYRPYSTSDWNEEKIASMNFDLAMIMVF